MALRLLRPSAIGSGAPGYVWAQPRRRRSDHANPKLIKGFVAPNELFAALDGRELHLADRRWSIDVYSISDLDGQRWVQLGLTGQSRMNVTMRLATGDGEQRAVLMLSAWLTTPSEVPEVLSVV